VRFTVIADRWGVCPRCRQAAKDKQKQALDAAEEQYGKVPSAEWLSLKRQAEALVAQPRETLREFFGLGFGSDGRFHIRYQCSCDRCGFEYKHEDAVEVPVDMVGAT
jgi:hypothetical protein